MGTEERSDEYVPVSSEERARIEATCVALNWAVGVLRVNSGPVAFDMIHEKCHRAWKEYDKHCIDGTGAKVGDTESEKALAKDGE